MAHIQIKHKLVVPSRWNFKEAKELLELERRIGSKSAHIHSFYASINDQPVGHGRNRLVVPHETITRKHAINFVSWVRESGKKFTFLVNGPCQKPNIKLSGGEVFDRRDSTSGITGFEGELNGEVLDYLRWIVSELKPTGVMVTSPALMLWFLNNSDLEVQVSSIVNIKSREDLKDLFGQLSGAKRSISTVVLGQDTSKLFENFLQLAGFAVFETPSGILHYELLVNETCLFECENRTAHHNAIVSRDLWPDPFQTDCNQEKIIRPDQLLRAGGLIPPQLLDFYITRGGIDAFKIAGRELPFESVKKATGAYLIGSFKGNMIELTAMTPPQISGTDGKGASDYFYVDAEALANLIRELSRTGIEKVEDFIRARAIEMHREGLLRVGDNKYEVVDGRLTLV